MATPRFGSRMALSAFAFTAVLLLESGAQCSLVTSLSSDDQVSSASDQIELKSDEALLDTSIDVGGDAISMGASFDGFAAFGGGDAMVVDTTVVDTPEPASMALLGLTCAGALGFGVRRRVRCGKNVSGRV